MDDVNIFAFLLFSLLLALSLLFLRARFKESRKGTRGDQGKERESGGGEKKSLWHPLSIMDELRWHSEKDQKWIKDIEHFSSKATRRWPV